VCEAELMIRDMREFVAEMQAKIGQWKAELAKIDNPENHVESQVAESLRQWIFAGETLIAASGY
jgi:hypothetical protein